MTDKPASIWDELRKPFPKEVIGKIPKGGISLDYVGHAAVTDRLNTVAGPDNWSWEPVAYDESGLPKLDSKGNLWIRLTVSGVSRLGYGDGSSSIKELIGDALRNAAMRFGVALDLWSKEELESTLADPSSKNERATAPARPAIGTDQAKTVEPPALASDAQRKMIYAVMGKKNIPADRMHDYLTDELEVVDTKAMTSEEASRVIDHLLEMAKWPDAQEGEAS